MTATNRRPPWPDVTLENVREALIIAAELVDLYGEKALPLFKRLEAEYHEMQRRGSAMERVRQIARGEVDLD